MTKAVIRIGYNDYVVSVEQAVAIAEAIATAPRFEAVGYGEDKATYIWDEPVDQRVSIHVISEELFRMASMAGKPDKRR